MTPASAQAPRPPGSTETGDVDPASHVHWAGDNLLASLGQASFVWDIASDTLQWSDNAPAVLRDIPQSALMKAGEFSRLIEPSRSIRNDAVLNATGSDTGEGVPYQIEYGVRASTSVPMLWIDECGRWFAGADGKPAQARGIIRINNERHARDEQLLKLSQDDPLTGAFNRTRLTAALAEAIEEANRFRSSFAFMLVGIDRLAQINDAFGYEVADQVILEVATRIRARLRGGDVIGRFSGNKFGLILKNCSVDDMHVAAERFLAGIRDDVVPTRSGAGGAHGIDRCNQCAAACKHSRRGHEPYAGSAGSRQGAAAWLADGLAAERRARGPAPRQYPCHR